jgi:TPR repeat protein
MKNNSYTNSLRSFAALWISLGLLTGTPMSASEKVDVGGILDNLERAEAEKQPWTVPDTLRERPANFVERLRHGADAGDPKDQATLGLCYQNGVGVKRDNAQAIEWYRKAAAKGHAGARNNLGMIYDQGVGVPRDPVKARELYVSAANAGLADAEFNLGLEFASEKNFVEARKWYQKAADQGHLRALNNLGNIYILGRGVPVDLELAKKYLTKPATTGIAVSQLGMASAFFAQKNVAEAMPWLRRSIQGGFIGAYGRYAASLYRGEGVERDVTAALDLARKVAKRGDGNSQALVALILLQNADKMPADPKEAYELARTSAERGNSFGERILGTCYYRGFGVKQDFQEAVHWYRLSAEQNDATAACNLAALLESGTGAARDIREAVKWYWVGAEAGDPTSQREFARILRDVARVAHDSPTALECARQCAETADAGGLAMLANILLENPGLVDPSETYHWAKKSADHGCAYGQKMVALCYHRGVGVERDVKEAMKWYRLAAEQGDPAAAGNLGVILLGGSVGSPDPVEGMKWLRKGAEAGDPTTQILLAGRLEMGQGVERDLSAALEWARKSAKGGNVLGQVMVAQRLLAFPTRNAAESSEAYQAARQAADQGNASGQALLGMCYQRGIGVERNVQEAAKWYRPAAEQRIPAAAANLGRLLKDGELGSPDPVQGVKWLLVGAEGGDFTAMGVLAGTLATGQGVPRDLPGAAKWMRLSLTNPDMQPSQREITQKTLDAIEKILADAHRAQPGKPTYESGKPLYEPGKPVF